jgi:hypothetical protein
MGITGQEPVAVGLFAVDGEPMACQLRCFSVGSRFHGQRVPAPCVGDLTEDGDLLNLAHALNPGALVTDHETVGEFTPANRLFAWIQKHDIVRHQGEQPRKIARIDRINPGGMHLAYCAFITSHVHIFKISTTTTAAK